MVAHHRCYLNIHLDRPARSTRRSGKKNNTAEIAKNDNIINPHGNDNMKARTFTNITVNKVVFQNLALCRHTWADIAPAIRSSCSNSATRAEADSCSADCLNSLWDLFGQGATSLYDPSGLIPIWVGKEQEKYNNVTGGNASMAKQYLLTSKDSFQSRVWLLLHTIAARRHLKRLLLSCQRVQLLLIWQASDRGIQQKIWGAGRQVTYLPETANSVLQHPVSSPAALGSSPGSPAASVPRSISKSLTYLKHLHTPPSVEAHEGHGWFGGGSLQTQMYTRKYSTSQQWILKGSGKMDTPRRLFSGFNMSRPITAPKKIVSASVWISNNSLHLVENHLAVNMMTISAKEVHSNLSSPKGSTTVDGQNIQTFSI